jgi:dihydrofolate reductase
MRKIISNTFVTLDGIMQAPGGPEEDTTGNFKYGGWSVSLWDDIMMQTMGEAMQAPYDLLLGRITYEIFAAHWPFVQNDPMADKLNNARKYVVSTKLQTADWHNSMLVRGDVVEEIKKIKQEEGPEIQVHGSSNLIQTLLKHNLIDELRLWIFPVVIGNGKRLFGEGAVPANLRLIEHKTSTTGVIMAYYQPAGELKTGSFALEEPSQIEMERRKELSKQQ